jgi:L(+)-tartrate dehydratase beta subunit
MDAAIERLDDVRMDEVRLTTPVADAELARLKLGDVVYLDGVLSTARESVYRRVVDEGVDLPASRPRAHQRELPLLARGDGPVGRHVRRGGRDRDCELPLRQVDEPLVRALGRQGDRRQGWAHGARVPRVVHAHGAVYLTAVGYGLGAAYEHCIKRVLDVYWLELAIAQALWVLEVEKLGPFLVEGDRRGRRLFALANREINLRLDEVYRGLAPYSRGRFGETTARKDEVV